ncbi:MAG: MerR family transcriptional regulator [Deltaproteobacteria bacterium]|nr:MerR family transcriptional regulator [Deltaproteobacteria bacterium]
MLRAAGLLGAQADARVSAAPDARTVRYYTTLGLLDRPALDGRSARYGQKHLLQLVAIKALQAEGLPLSDIQSRLYGRGEGELKQLADLLVAKAREIEPPAPSLRTVTEIVLAPGMKLVVEDGWEVSEPGFVEQQFRAALAAIVKARIGPGGK